MPTTPTNQTTATSTPRRQTRLLAAATRFPAAPSGSSSGSARPSTPTWPPPPTGLTTTSYVAETVLAATRGATPDGQQDRRGISRRTGQLQRDLFAVRTALNRIGSHLERVATTPSTGSAPTRPDDEIAA
jgi:hypothetical protein